MIDVQYVGQWPARGRAEGIAGVVGGGDQRALPDVAGKAEQRGDLGLVVQVQRGPGGPQSPGPAGQHVAPRGGQQRSPQRTDRVVVSSSSVVSGTPGMIAHQGQDSA